MNKFEIQYSLIAKFLQLTQQDYQSHYNQSDSSHYSDYRERERESSATFASSRAAGLESNSCDLYCSSNLEKRQDKEDAQSLKKNF